MAADYYLQLDGIKGESADSRHAGWTECMSINWSITQPKSATASTGGGHTAERAELSEINISKLVDLVRHGRRASRVSSYAGPDACRRQAADLPIQAIVPCLHQYSKQKPRRCKLTRLLFCRARKRRELDPPRLFDSPDYCPCPTFSPPVHTDCT